MATGAKCGCCDKTVYPHEPNLNLDGRIFHKGCAKCKDCGKGLSVLNFGKSSDFIAESYLLCKIHYKELLVRTTNYKGGWEASAREGIQLVIPKSAKKFRPEQPEEEDNQQVEEEEEEDLFAAGKKRKSIDEPCDSIFSPSKRISIGAEGASPISHAPSPAAADISQNCSEEDDFQNNPMNPAEQSDFISQRRVQFEESTLHDLSTAADGDDSMSVLNMTTNTIDTEITDFMNASKSEVDEDTFTTEEEEPDTTTAVINDKVLVFKQSEEQVFPAQNISEPSEQEEEEEEVLQEDSVRARIMALNKNKSKFVPTPFTNKKADEIDVKFFGPNRVTLNQTSSGIDTASLIENIENIPVQQQQD